MGNNMRVVRRPEGDVLKGLVAGLVGGLFASWAMNGFQALTTKLAEEMKSAQDKQAKKKVADGGEQKEGNDATVKAAQAISEGVFAHKLTKTEKQVAGPAVHYAVGTAAGGFYGALAEVAPVVSVGPGLPFGAVFWLLADEAAVPALGLSQPPNEVPLATHAYALASHFVYGLTTDLVRHAVRHAL